MIREEIRGVREREGQRSALRRHLMKMGKLRETNNAKEIRRGGKGNL